MPGQVFRLKYIRPPTGDEMDIYRPLWAELNSAEASRGHAVRETLGMLVLGVKGVYDVIHNSNSTALGLTEKRSGIELLGLREAIDD